jgi:hypothetical protein
MAALSLLAGITSLAAVARGAEAKEAEAARVDVLSWLLGKPRPEVVEELARPRWRPVPRGRHALLVEAPVIADVFAMQRALFELDATDRLRAVTVHLLPDRTGDAGATLELYADARALLLRRLGNPAWSRDEGALGGATASALFAGRLVRCVQWERDGTVRLGIPRSPSGELRVEIQRANGPLPPADGYWGRDF